MTDSPRRPGPGGSERRKLRAARVLEGLGAAPGVAIGRAVILERGSTQVYRTTIAEDGVEAEVERLESAVEQTREQLSVIRNKLAKASGDEYAFIFDAHVEFLKDK